jgi:hypothetical protein
LLTRLLVLNAGRFPDPGVAKEPNVQRSTTATSEQMGSPKRPWPLRYTHDRAIRQEPRVTRVRRLDGRRVTVHGEHFGTALGRVVFGKTVAKISKWSETQIDVTVPRRVRNSRASVHCPDRVPRLTMP